MRAYSLHHRRRRGIREDGRVDHLRPVNDHAQLAQRPSLTVDVERRIPAKLCRHPGGNEGLAGSDRAVVDLDAAHEGPRVDGERSNPIGRGPTPAFSCEALSYDAAKRRTKGNHGAFLAPNSPQNHPRTLIAGGSRRGRIEMQAVALPTRERGTRRSRGTPPRLRIRIRRVRARRSASSRGTRPGRRRPRRSGGRLSA